MNLEGDGLKLQMDFLFTVYDPKASEQTPKCVLKKYSTGALIENKRMCPEFLHITTNERTHR